MKEKFEELYQKEYKHVLAYCVVRLGSQSDAEEIAGQAFMKLWEKMQVAEPANLRAFLFRCAHNAVIDYYRFRRVRRTESYQQIDPQNYTEIWLPEVHADERQQTDTRALARETYEILHKVLNKEELDMIVALFYEGHTPKSYGSTIGLPGSTVSVRRHRALQKVREYINTCTRYRFPLSR